MQVNGRELIFALRSVARRAVESVSVALTLAFGIGVSLAAVMLLDVFVVRQLPVADPDTLFEVVRLNEEGVSSPFSYARYTELREQTQLFRDVLAIGNVPTGDVRVDGGETVNARVMLVSENYFALLGAPLLFGQAWESEGSPQNAIISYRFWRRVLGGGSAPRTLGQRIDVNGVSTTVIGVAAPAFRGTEVGEPVDIWLPLGLQPQLSTPNRLTAEWIDWLQLIGRSEATVHQDALAGSLSEWFLRTGGGESERLVLASAAHGTGPLRTKYQRPVLVIGMIAGFILLVAWIAAGVSRLAHAHRRRDEFGVRMALGASTDSLSKQILWEGVIISVGAMGLGLPLAIMFSELMLGMATAVEYRTLEVEILSMNGPLAVAIPLVFLVSIAVCAIGLFEFSSRQDKGRGLANGAARMPQRTSLRVSRRLISLQIAMSLPLVLGVILLLQSLNNVDRLDLGIDRGQIVMVRIPFQPQALRLGKDTSRQDRLVRRLESIPGVLSASLATSEPIQSNAGKDLVSGSGSQRAISSVVHAVSDGYFRTFGIAIDEAAGPIGDGEPMEFRSAVVNQKLATMLWDNDSPVGKKVSLGPVFEDRTALTVTGVSASVRTSFRTEGEPAAYVPLALTGYPVFSVAVRTGGVDNAIAPMVREAIVELEPDMKLGKTVLLREELERQTAPERLVSQLCAIFGGLAVLLMAIGLHGTMSRMVRYRQSELALRVALGASAAQQAGLVLADAFRIAVVGLAFGVLISLQVSSLLASFLFGVSQRDVWSYTIAALWLLLVVAFSALVPAIRAARVVPMAELRRVC